MVVSDSYEDAPGIRIIELRAECPAVLPRFEASAHITLHLPEGLSTDAFCDQRTAKPVLSPDPR
jgi:hypothetical protein